MFKFVFNKIKKELFLIAIKNSSINRKPEREYAIPNPPYHFFDTILDDEIYDRLKKEKIKNITKTEIWNYVNKWYGAKVDFYISINSL